MPYPAVQYPIQPITNAPLAADGQKTGCNNQYTIFPPECSATVQGPNPPPYTPNPTSNTACHAGSEGSIPYPYGPPNYNSCQPGNTSYPPGLTGNFLYPTGPTCNTPYPGTTGYTSCPTGPTSNTPYSGPTGNTPYPGPIGNTPYFTDSTGKTPGLTSNISLPCNSTNNISHLPGPIGKQ